MKKKQLKVNKKNVIILLCIVLIICLIAGIALNLGKTSTIELSPEMSRSQDYSVVEDGEEYVYDNDGNRISYVNFDAFFLKDTDGDGVAESIRGTCNEVGSQATLYMDLSVWDDGYITDATITINSENFYFKTSLVADTVIASNCISENTKTISLNDVTNGTEKLIIGYVRSGDYTSTSTKTSAIGNDTTNYTKVNSITLNGTFVDSSGNETEFTKTVEFTVDWYGEVDADISLSSTGSTKSTTKNVTDMSSLISDDGLTLSYTVYTRETLNELILAGNYIYGTMPELNGYLPTSVKITGTNVTYTYDETTGEYTAQREAVLDDSGTVTSNAYTSMYNGTRYNSYTFTVVYPIEAYEEMGEDVTSFSLTIPVSTYNTGYNNENADDGFENPYVSDTVSSSVTVTWKKYADSAYFSIYVGTYKSSPWYHYVISKKKPLNIYNGISLEETDDTYLVEWRAYTGTNGETDGIIMSETSGYTDRLRDASGNYTSMDEFTTNAGVYFSGATATLGSDGWIKVYDADTDTLLATFTSSNWEKYTSTAPYVYENSVKHIRVETSSTNANSYFYVYSIKELDDEYITENYTREEFDEFEYIYSYLSGQMINETTDDATGETTTTTYCSANVSNYALYVEPTSIATISITEDVISTQVTAENEIIKISTVTSGWNEQGWVNGTFLVQLPSDIILAEINDITIDNSNVTVSAYSVYEEDGYYYVKILTENDSEETYTISIDCDLTADPRITSTTETVKLYAINEAGSDYYYHTSDVYDVDGDSNTTEEVNYRTTTLTLEPGTTLTSVQIASNYDNTGDITIAPRVAKTDKSQRTATIEISLTNNYTYDIEDIKIQGVIPFDGNTSILSGTDLSSDFTTYMQESGISVLTDGLEDYVTIYYSANETPSNDVSISSNGWTLAEDVEDWTAIKTYLIVIDSSYELSTGETIEFSYNISLPEGVDYNEVTYAAFGVNFALATEEGLYYTSTAPAKIGFMIAKQYDLEIVKYQEDTTKTIQGVTFALTEVGEESSTIATTDENGVLTLTGLYAERYYSLQEVKTTDDYVLNTEEITFYTYTVTNEDDSESLYLVYENDDGSYSSLTDIYSFIKDAYVTQNNADDEEDYKITLEIENEVKAKLVINKTDGDTGEVLKNVSFTITGEGKDGEIVKTDSNGVIEVSGLYLDTEYVIEEVKAKGYYVLSGGTITIKLVNDNGEFKLTTVSSENGTADDGSSQNLSDYITVTSNVTTNDYIPTINLNITNEEIPTYGLQITKYSNTGEVLSGAQYKILGEGISDNGKIYTCDENGVITIDGLYEYVDGKYITGIYTVYEVYAPEGYALNATELQFRAYRENGTLKIEIISGEDVIRTITSTTEVEGETIETTSQDLNIENASTNYPIIQIGVEDSPIFTLYKKDGSTSSAIAGAKFKIMDLNDNYVYGSDGKIVGELETINGEEMYVLTTDENGQLTANLGAGLYKAVEVYVDDSYVFDDDEDNRTWYFGIDASQAATFDWVQSILGYSWNYINSTDATKSGGVVAAGSISEYSSSTVSSASGGADVNSDGTLEETSTGGDDGLLVVYDVDGNYVMSEVFGGTDDDAFNKVVQTSDGGYAVVGYVSSSTVYLNNTEEISSLSLSNYSTFAGKDAVLLKLDSAGNYEWAVRLGGTGDDEITSVIETSDGGFAVVGRYYSDTFNFYDKDDYEVKDSFDNLGKMDGFVALYSSNGEYVWSQRIGGTYDVEATDVTETSAGIVVSVNYIGATTSSGAVYLDTAKSTYQIGVGTSSVNGMIIGYGLSDGAFQWRYRLQTTNSTSYQIDVSSLDTTTDGNIIIGMNYSGIVYGRNNTYGNSTATTTAARTTIVETAPSSYLYDFKILKFSSDGEYVGDLYTLSGDYDDYVASVEATSDGGVLLGGWYYSTAGVDVDGDGDTTGSYDLPEISGTYTSDGFVIKIDGQGTVEYASRLYGDGYDLVTTVTETKNGAYVSGGNFNSTTLTATNINLESEDEDEEESSTTRVIMTKKATSEAFVISEGADDPEVAASASVNATNNKKNFTITTEVENSTGGTITGKTGTYNDVVYTDILYVENVDYGETSIYQIEITPDTGYTVDYITINGTEYTNFTSVNGVVTLSVFENVTEDIHIVVAFSNTISSIEVNHYLWTETEGQTTTNVAESESYSGEVDTEYSTIPATDIEYVLITNEDYYSSDSNLLELADELGEGVTTVSELYTNYSVTTLAELLDALGVDPDDYYIPSNATGTYEEGVTQVIDYYYKEKTYTLTVHHYLAGTNEQVPSTEGGTVADEVSDGWTKDAEYNTNEASTVDYDIYELVEIPANATGTITENTEVIYYYQLITADINIIKVAQEDTTVTLSGTEFALYKLNCTEHDEGYHDDRLVEEDSDCWELVDTYTSSSTGKVSLEDLVIAYEYRLVETKASEDRMIASGEWKIEFIYESEAGAYGTDDTIISVAGTLIRVTAVGNPPAVQLSDDGNSLLVANKEYYVIPTSGGLGVEDYYEIGIIIMIAGLIIFAVYQVKRHSTKIIRKAKKK